MAGDYFIGCISGTSLDGLDLALCEISDSHIRVVASDCLTIPDPLQQALTALCSPGPNEVERLGSTDMVLGSFIGEAINSFIASLDLAPEQILAVGSHGQTIRHCPDHASPFSMQIGNGHMIAQRTGITTVADFRLADMADGGQGAPLVPAFHQFAFSADETPRLIINLGGISNISVITPRVSELPASIGFDIGPANTLMDRWAEQHLGKPYDANGYWAATGSILPDLLEAMLRDPFFQLQGPKSTGREYFNLSWLKQFNCDGYDAADVQRTLLELTCLTVSQTIKANAATANTEVFVCGGGAHNGFALARMKELLPGLSLQTTTALGIPVDDVEASAFAWLARKAILREPVDLRSVTGAHHPNILGALFYA